MSTPVTTRLTSYSHGAGCACKLGASELSEILRNLPHTVDPRVLVDASSRDDAAVFALAPDRALIATTDFFTPIVDDAATWGAIAATNALSDVYAMGGTPLFALELVGWPRASLPFSLLGEVLQGAARVAQQARCLLVGGHSIDDPEPKFGLAVIGEVHPERVFKNTAAKPGDVLVLTKPLGTGVLTTALKRDAVSEADLEEAVTCMTTLNDGAMRAAQAAQVRAATDVTGFGLTGHLGNILRSSGVGAEIRFTALPFLQRARELAERGMVPGGTRRNLTDATHVLWDPSLSEPERLLCSDAQTSGGLLLAVSPDRRDDVLRHLQQEKTLAAAVIGHCTAETGVLRVTR